MTAAPLFPVRSVEIRRGAGLHPAEPPHVVWLRALAGTWSVRAGLHDSEDTAKLVEAAAAGPVTLAVGDAAEVACGTGFTVNASLFTVDISGSRVDVVVSRTGLPPVFLQGSGDAWSVSSPFLPALTGESPQVDLAAVADTLRWGHPIDGRTLVAGLSAVQAGGRIGISDRPVVTEDPGAPWERTPAHQDLASEDLVTAQCREFLRAADRLPTDGAFLSLSGGLDSRAALVALVMQGRRLPCVTLAGSDANLDALLAAEFCLRHGLEHQLVRLGADFRSRLPDLVLQAARLTGGVSALSQAVDVYLYESVPGFRTRISGNLGNQVGRGGVESLSAYDTDESLYSPDVRQHLAHRPKVPWFLDRMQKGAFPAVLFGQEVHFWSIPNYVVGSAQARQLSPYASAALMQLSVELFARDPGLNPVEWQQMRRRDVRHRLHGPPLDRSFQRKLLADFEGRGFRVPLNWGWYAGGRWSPRWRLRAGMAVADAAILKLSRQSALFKSAGHWVSGKLGHPSALVDWPDVLRTTLRDLAHDLLSSRDVRESGVFSAGRLEQVLAEHYAGTANHHAVLARALEIALAIRVRRGH